MWYDPVMNCLALSLSFTALIWASPAAAHEIETCPDGTKRTVVRELLHKASIEFETAEEMVNVNESTELVTIPATYKWIDDVDSYVQADTLTYDDLVYVPPTFKTVLLPGQGEFRDYDILLNRDGTYEKISPEDSEQLEAIKHDVQRKQWLVDTPAYYKPVKKTIPMPEPIEVDGRFKVLDQPSKTLPRLLPPIVKKRTYRLIKSRTPAVFQDTLSPCPD